jgi:hypothetical protein
MFDGVSFVGSIASYDKEDELFHVVYEDGDEEDLERQELDEARVLVSKEEAAKLLRLKRANSRGARAETRRVKKVGGGKARGCKFIKKLWEMVHTEHLGIISWNKEGDSIIVHDIPRLEIEVLPLYFRSAAVNSFRRQLGYFGFSSSLAVMVGGLLKYKGGKGEEAVSSKSMLLKHALFQRGKPADVLLITRKFNTGNSSASSTKLKGSTSSSAKAVMKGTKRKVGADVEEEDEQEVEVVKKQKRGGGLLPMVGAKVSTLFHSDGKNPQWRWGHVIATKVSPYNEESAQIKYAEDGTTHWLKWPHQDTIIVQVVYAPYTTHHTPHTILTHHRAVLR